ncbi:hypothetical protein [Parvicella tangerina]|uniref:Uncharacterized protein n=1 Tax=Parvicella tangerina TaxID=2829795 RepID=A0A916JNH3_9FLAO|nr:hypothetical protein [Parvicella tangerina]CAG5080886.1 hypothetical protein CRYO30217_01470 [Parvicella tangerina]
MLRSIVVGCCVLFSVSFFSQDFIGDISGKMVENDFLGEFIWRFEKGKTLYILEFEMEHEEHRIEITFDGDTTAQVEIYEEGVLTDQRPFTPSQLKKEVLVVSRDSDKGPELLSFSTEQHEIRTDDREIVTYLADISVNWNGADHFFTQDVPFALSCEHKGKFPLKIKATDLKGELKYSFIVETIKEKG